MRFSFQTVHRAGLYQYTFKRLQFLECFFRTLRLSSPCRGAKFLVLCTCRPGMTGWPPVPEPAPAPCMSHHHLARSQKLFQVPWLFTWQSNYIPWICQQVCYWNWPDWSKHPQYLIIVIYEFQFVHGYIDIPDEWNTIIMGTWWKTAGWVCTVHWAHHSPPEENLEHIRMQTWPLTKTVEMRSVRCFVL